METKSYWVMRTTSPRRNLCTDGILRRNLKDAPSGVSYMKFGTEPAYDTIRKMVEDEMVKDSIYLIFLRALFIGEMDYHCPYSGAVHHNGIRDIKEKITNSGLFDI